MILEKIAERLSALLMLFAGVAVALMCLHIVIDVISKFVFNAPVLGTLELVSNYYMIGTVFLPFAYTQHQRGHVTVDLFTHNLGPRVLGAFDAVVLMIWALAMLVFSWQTFEYAMEKTELNESLALAFNDILIWPARWIVPISTSALALLLIMQSIRGAIQALTKQPLPNPQERFGHEITEA